MQINFAAPQVDRKGTLVVAASDRDLLPAASGLDQRLGGALKRAAQASRFKGKPGQIVELLSPSGIQASRVLLIGIGRADKIDGPAAEKVGAAAVARLLTSGETDVMFVIDSSRDAKIKPGQLAAHVALGAQLRSYSFHKYRTKQREEHEPTLANVTIGTGEAAAARKAWDRLRAVAEGVFLARNLVNEPPNVMSPQEFAERAKALGKLGVKVEVLGEDAMRKLGMNTLLGVGQGSERESQLVIMQWNGGRKKDQPVAFVGKGVCFDSGGLSLKPGASMMGMKGDMGGAAAVTGTMLALASRKAKVNAVGILGLVENMPDGKAQRPDDVVTSMSGQTIEILNTDAEGRLVLADALWYAQTKFKPKFVIDLATLTGAILIALGLEHAGLFSNDDKLANRIQEAGSEVGEPVWRLPLSEAYDKMLKSKIADMKNISGVTHAGSIVAAQFLQRFIDKTPWAHLDIAGVAWQDGEQKPLSPGWGVGWGVRILDRLVADHYEK
jgi:leucyl aminopeptidase